MKTIHWDDQGEAFAARAGFTDDLTLAANTLYDGILYDGILYDGILYVQNAARLEYPSTRPGTAAARARFLLETFPPRDRSQPDGGTQPHHPPPAP